MSESTATCPRRILIIDDTPAIHADYRKVLVRQPDRAPLQAEKAAIFGLAPGPQTNPTLGLPEFDVDSAYQGEPGVEMAEAACQQNRPYQVAFVDMRMPPGWDGLTTVQQLWRVDPRIQIVICTAYSEHSHEQIAQELGTSDKLLILRKPFDRAEIWQLATTLCQKWRVERLAELRIDELEHAVSERTTEIEHALLHDRLTGLPNRTLITTRLNACIQRHSRCRSFRFALLYLDFDRFKIINDSLGHEVGDLLLIAIGKRLSESLRQLDVICRNSTPSRIGGDEFIILLEDLTVERDAATVANRLLTLLAAPFDVMDQQLHLSCSVGIATSEQNYTSAADMIRDADTAMYRAKNAGRARYVLFDAHMHEQVMSRLYLEQSLRQALATDGLSVYYQPIVRLSDGIIAGFEALVRWQHPTLGSVPAPDLISVAEESGLIQPLGMFVLRAACAQLRIWQDDAPGEAPLMMSVNLSRFQLVDFELVDKIAATVRATGIREGSLTLEVTETAAFAEGVDTESLFRRLRELGIWLHLDDFGTGYSGLSCLYRLPLSGLKIDRAFLREVCSQSTHLVVLDAIVRIARVFQLQVICEGVESTEQLEMLHELGVDHAQGYLFGKAVCGADATALLVEGSYPLEAYQRIFASAPCPPTVAAP